MNKSVFSLRSIILLARTPDMLLELLAVGSTDGCTVQALLCGDNAKCSLQVCYGEFYSSDACFLFCSY